jgi:hypothetical protein
LRGLEVIKVSLQNQASLNDMRTTESAAIDQRLTLAFHGTLTATVPPRLLSQEASPKVNKTR